MQYTGHDVQALVRVDLVPPLFDLAGVVQGFHFHHVWLLHELLGQLADVVRVGGAEHQRLAVARAGAHDADDFFDKAHVHHAVGFIQHQRFHAGQLQRAARQVVLQAARGAYHDVGAVFQRRALRRHWRTTAQGDDLDIVDAARQAADFLRDLVGQLARGAQYQCLNGKPARVDVSEQAQAKCCCLAAAGFGLCDDVAAVQYGWQAFCLNGGHAGVAQAIEVGKQVLRQLQGAEFGFVHNDLAWVDMARRGV